MPWATVEEALSAFRRNEFILVMDSDDREDECDLVIAAEHITAEQMAFCIRQTTGIICVVADKARLEGFGLHPATAKNTDVNETNFYVSTDFIPGTSTGVSAADRACTAREFCNMSHSAEAFSKPGHIFPLCSKPGGVLERPGHTESCYDLCRLSGLKHVGVIGELMHEDGTMYRRSDSLEFSEKHNIPIITVDALIEHRKKFPLPSPSIQTSRL
jgi:3,4-dihydroxy-2-butanone 4-phosphate synthase